MSDLHPGSTDIEISSAKQGKEPELKPDVAPFVEEAHDKLKRLHYYFEEITRCEMCGDSTANHRLLGQRLSQSQGLHPNRKEGISVSVKKCTVCELIYASPQPIPADIQDHYGVLPENYWRPGYFEWNENYFSKQIRIAKELLDFREGMLALDIGAGLGKAMLSLNSAGFDSYGIEPSKSFYERAISIMKINPLDLKLGMVEEVDYPPNTFDFISFSAVFEHLYHPARSLEKAMRWLKPGGIIQIEVPSSKHLIAKLINIYFNLAGTNYVTHISPMHSPFHLYEFGLKSFEALGRKLHYKIVRADYTVGEIAHIPGFLHPVFRKIMEKTNTGLQLTVWLKK